MGVRATVYDASNTERIAMNEREPMGEWRVSLWFVILSPLLGIVVGVLALLVLAD